MGEFTSADRLASQEFRETGLQMESEMHFPQTDLGTLLVE